ncbi:MAG: ATP-binding protein [Clostridia bacterium]|nr:ATP-binding protein [Clostridia bacterium]
MNLQTISEALLKIKESKSQAERKFEAEIKAVTENNQEIKELDNLLKQIGAKTALTAITGNQAALDALKNKALLLTAKKADLLKAAGAPAYPDYSCKKCNDSGYIEGEICECVKTEAKRIALQRVFGSDLSNGATFDNFSLKYYPEDKDESGYSPKKVMTTTLKISKEFAAKFPEGKNLLFIGGCGLGKTHLSLAIAAELASNGYDVIYGSAQNLLQKAVRDSMDWSSDGSFTDHLLSADLLVMDDLGTEFGTTASNSVLYNIIDTRLQRGLSTIINTNVEFEDLEKKYDPRIASRLIGNYTARYFLGNDIRQIKAEY